MTALKDVFRIGLIALVISAFLIPLQITQVKKNLTHASKTI